MLLFPSKRCLRKERACQLLCALACTAILQATGAAGVAAAQDDQCHALNVASLLTGRVLQITYDLDARPDVKACRVKLAKVEVCVQGEGGCVELDPVRTQGDLGVVAVGKGKFVRSQFDVPPPFGPIKTTLDTVPLRPWHLGAMLFTSVESRVGTAALGQHQALGSMAALGIPLGRVWELGFEASGALWRDALDSEQFAAFAERRYLRDSFFSSTVGRTVQFGKRVQLVPVAGGGLAALRTDHLRYSVVRGAVQTLAEGSSRSVPVLTAGADVRFELGNHASLVVQDRLHVLGGPKEPSDPRQRIQHRPGLGLQVNFGG